VSVGRSSDPFSRARARVAADRMAKEVCSNYYTVLVRTESDQRKAGFGKICDGVCSREGARAGDDLYLNLGDTACCFTRPAASPPPSSSLTLLPPPVVFIFFFPAFYLALAPRPVGICW